MCLCVCSNVCEWMGVCVCECVCMCVLVFFFLHLSVYMCVCALIFVCVIKLQNSLPSGLLLCFLAPSILLICWPQSWKSSSTATPMLVSLQIPVFSRLKKRRYHLLFDIFCILVSALANVAERHAWTCFP